MEDSIHEEAMWTVDDVATYLKVSKPWVYASAKAGTIPGNAIAGLGANKNRLWRFVPADIRAFARGEWQPEAKSA